MIVKNTGFQVGSPAAAGQQGSLQEREKGGEIDVGWHLAKAPILAGSITLWLRSVTVWLTSSDVSIRVATDRLPIRVASNRLRSSPLVQSVSIRRTLFDLSACCPFVCVKNPGSQVGCPASA